MGLPKPDLVLFLQLRVAEAVGRGGFGLERYEDGAFQQRVLRCFHQLMEDATLNWKVSRPSRRQSSGRPQGFSQRSRWVPLGYMGDSLTGTSPTSAISPGGPFPELTTQQAPAFRWALAMQPCHPEHETHVTPTSLCMLVGRGMLELAVCASVLTSEVGSCPFQGSNPQSTLLSCSSSSRASLHPLWGACPCAH